MSIGSPQFLRQFTATFKNSEEEEEEVKIDVKQNKRQRDNNICLFNDTYNLQKQRVYTFILQETCNKIFSALVIDGKSYILQKQDKKLKVKILNATTYAQTVTLIDCKGKLWSSKENLRIVSDLKTKIPQLQSNQSTDNNNNNINNPSSIKDQKEIASDIETEEEMDEESTASVTTTQASNVCKTVKTPPTEQIGEVLTKWMTSNVTDSLELYISPQETQDKKMNLHSYKVSYQKLKNFKESFILVNVFHEAYKTQKYEFKKSVSRLGKVSANLEIPFNILELCAKRSESTLCRLTDNFNRIWELKSADDESDSVPMSESELVTSPVSKSQTEPLTTNNNNLEITSLNNSNKKIKFLKELALSCKNGNQELKIKLSNHGKNGRCNIVVKNNVYFLQVQKNYVLSIINNQDIKINQIKLISENSGEELICNVKHIEKYNASEIFFSLTSINSSVELIDENGKNWKTSEKINVMSRLKERIKKRNLNFYNYHTLPKKGDVQSNLDVDDFSESEEDCDQIRSCAQAPSNENLADNLDMELKTTKKSKK